MEELVTTVEETATEIAATVDTVVGQIEETVEIVEQVAAPVEEATATPEVTGDPAEGVQVTDSLQAQESTEQPLAPAPATEQTVTETAEPVVLAPVTAGPLDAVEVLGGAFQETVLTVEETAPVTAGPLDAVEVLGGAFQETVLTVEETAPVTAGPLDAVEVLGGAFQETVTTVEETAPVTAGPLDAVEVLGGAFQETVTTVEDAGQEILAAVEGLEGQVQDVATTVEATAQEIVDSVGVLQLQIEEAVNSAEQAVEQTADQADAILAGEIRETVSSVEETTQELLGVMETLEANIAETVDTVQTTAGSVVDAAVVAAGESQAAVESVMQAADQVVDVVEVLQTQVETAVATVEEAAQIVEIIEVLEAEVANGKGPTEPTTQQTIQAIEGHVAQIEGALGPLEETAPQIVVAVEGLVERMEDSIQLVSDSGLQIEPSAVAPLENAEVAAGPVDAVEVIGREGLALQRASLEASLLGAESATAVEAGGTYDSAINKASGASVTNVPIATGDAGRRGFFGAPFSAAGTKGPVFSASRFLLNWTAILGVSQPSLAILVDAVNDADEDGIYSDSEIAAVPGADVNFKALITNIGAVNFEIASVTHGYNGGTGPAQGGVCGELVGIMLAPGESLACSFPVPDYAPARGGTLVSTITAAGFEVGKGARRGASDSDISRVDTLLAGDDVLAVAIKRNLAFTGTDAARLLALGLLLLGAGGLFLALARLRSRPPVRPLPSESAIDVLGWWAAGPLRPDASSKLRRWKTRQSQDSRDEA